VLTVLQHGWVLEKFRLFGRTLNISGVVKAWTG